MARFEQMSLGGALYLMFVTGTFRCGQYDDDSWYLEWIERPSPEGDDPERELVIFPGGKVDE